MRGLATAAVGPVLGVLAAVTLATAASAAPGDAKLNPPSITPTTGTTATDALSPSPSPGAVRAGSRPFNVPIEGVVAIGLLGAVTVAAALGERRRRRAVEPFRAAQAGGATPLPGEGSEEWEPDVTDDEETVATIEYEPPDEPLKSRDR